MNPFAALESDDEDETFTKVQSNKKTDNKKKVQTQTPVTTSSTPAVINGNAVSDNKTSSRGGGGRGDNRNRGRGAGRGGKETGERLKNNKREYDRRSGTGRGTEVSKGGAGKGGWGTNEDEITQQVRELEAEKEGVEKTTTTEEKTVTEVVEEEPIEPEVPTFTLDEYLARRDASRQNSSVFTAVETRKVTDDYSGLKTKSDVQDSFIVLGGDQKNKVVNRSQRSTAQTKVTDLGFHAAPKEDRREDRGGKGGGRGGDRGGKGGDRDRGGKGGDRGGRGGRGGGKGGERRPPRTNGKVDINDQSAFPSL